jgi:hypothetical protein
MLPNISVEQLTQLVAGTRDDVVTAEAIESTREFVTPENVEALVRGYDELLTWPAREALVHLIQDHAGDSARSMLRDFLRNSPPDAPDSEWLGVARAIAACHLDRDFTNFEELVASPEAIAAAKARWAGGV